MTTQPPPPGQQPPAAPPPRRKGMHPLAIAGIAVAGVLVLITILGLIGLAIGPDDEGQAEAATTSAVAAPTTARTTTAAPSSPPAAPTTPTASVPPANASPAPAAAPAPTDPRCAPAAANLVAMVEAGLTTAGNRLTNALQITHNSTVFIGATTVDSTGQIKQRSDVWIIRDGAVYSSTGGARNGSSFPRASSAIDIGPDDERVQAVDACVVAASRGR